MRSLWFKQRYVAPILEGAKTSTVRRGHLALPVGTRLSLSVGPRSPFAWVEVTRCEAISIDDLTESEHDAITLLYPTHDQHFTRLHFRLVAVP